jgi:hypothetical protein
MVISELYDTIAVSPWEHLLHLSMFVLHDEC